MCVLKATLHEIKEKIIRKISTISGRVSCNTSAISGGVSCCNFTITIPKKLRFIVPQFCTFWTCQICAISGELSYHNFLISGSVSYHNSKISGGLSWCICAIFGGVSTISGEVSYHNSSNSGGYLNTHIFRRGILLQLHIL